VTALKFDRGHEKSIRWTLLFFPFSPFPFFSSFPLRGTCANSRTPVQDRREDIERIARNVAVSSSLFLSPFSRHSQQRAGNEFAAHEAGAGRPRKRHRQPTPALFPPPFLFSSSVCYIGSAMETEKQCWSKNPATLPLSPFPFFCRAANSARRPCASRSSSRSYPDISVLPFFSPSSSRADRFDHSPNQSLEGEQGGLAHVFSFSPFLFPIPCRGRKTARTSLSGA